MTPRAVRPSSKPLPHLIYGVFGRRVLAAESCLAYHLLFEPGYELVSTNFSERDEAAAVFGRALPLIDVTLRREFRLPKVHARQVEEDVSVWFSRFALRPGNVKSVEVQRLNLFWATCQAARQYWQWRLEGAPAADDRVRRALNRDPHELAKELEEKLREREERRARRSPQESGT